MGTCVHLKEVVEFMKQFVHLMSVIVAAVFALFNPGRLLHRFPLQISLLRKRLKFCRRVRVSWTQHLTFFLTSKRKVTRPSFFRGRAPLRRFRTWVEQAACSGWHWRDLHFSAE